MSEHEEEPITEQDAAEEEQAHEAEQEQAQQEHEADFAGAEASAPQPPTQKEIEKRLEKLDAEAQRHSKRVAEIMGDDFGMLLPSPLDWTPGFVFRPDVAPLDPAAYQATMAYLGGPGAADYKDDPERAQCDLCGGLGKLKTGSLVENQDALPCRKCRGQGWYGEGNLPPLAPPAQIGTSAGAATVTYTQPPMPPPNTPVQAADRWGRPAGHPHYGIDPVQVGIA